MSSPRFVSALAGLSLLLLLASRAPAQEGSMPACQLLMPSTVQLGDTWNTCIIASPDERRGETVKLVVVLKPGISATEREILEWSRTQMAAYKVPRKLEFADALPRTGSGKLMWRALQEREWERETRQ